MIYSGGTGFGFDAASGGISSLPEDQSSSSGLSLAADDSLDDDQGSSEASCS